MKRIWRRRNNQALALAIIFVVVGCGGSGGGGGGAGAGGSGGGGGGGGAATPPVTYGNVCSNALIQDYQSFMTQYSTFNQSIATPPIDDYEALSCYNTATTLYNQGQQLQTKYFGQYCSLTSSTPPISIYDKLSAAVTALWSYISNFQTNT